VVLWLAAQAGLILAFLPWTPFFLQHYHIQNTTYWPGALSLSFIARRALFDFVSGKLLDSHVTQRVAGTYLALSLIGLVAALLRATAHTENHPKQASLPRTSLSRRNPSEPGLSLPRPGTSPAVGPSFPVVGSNLFLLAYLAVPLLLTFALTYNRPKFFSRYLLFLSPAFFILTAAGVRTFLPLHNKSGLLHGPERRSAPKPRDLEPSHVAHSRRAVRGLQFIALASAFTLSLGLLLDPSALALRNWFFNPRYGKDDFRAVGRYLETAVAPDEAIILSSGHAFPVFTYYYPRSDWHPIPSNPTPAPSAIDPLPLSIGAELNRIAAGRRGLWLVLWQNEVVDPNGLLVTLLDKVGRNLPVGKVFKSIEVRHYALPPDAHFPERADAQRSIESTLAGDIALLGYEVLNEPVPSDQTADVVLFWRTMQPTQADYRISLRLKDGDGNQVSRLDRRPAGFMYPTQLWKSGEEVMGRHALPLPPGLLPGSYDLGLVFYPASDVTDAQGVGLGQLTVTRPSRPPHSDELVIPYRTTATFGPLELLGHDLAPADVLPGDILEITLFWHAATKPLDDYEVVAIVEEGRTVPLAFSYPTSHWQAGDIFRTYHRLVLPADLPAGEIQVRIAVNPPGGNALALPATLAVLRVGSWEHRFAEPTGIQHPLRADLGGYVAFLGHDRDAETLKPGETLHLTLYWQAQQEMDISYKVFTHLLGHDGLVWGQQDSIPLQGARPTTGWLPGEVMADAYDITLHSDAPAGDYVIEVGMYDPSSGERLKVSDESGRRLPDDRILLDQIRVER